MECRDIGRRVRALRKKAGLTMMEVAGKVGRSQGQISRLENGQQSFKSATLLQLAEVLGVRPIEFFIEERAQRAEVPALLSPRLAHALKQPGFVKLAEMLAGAYDELPDQFSAIANVAETVLAATGGREEEPVEAEAEPEPSEASVQPPS